MRKSTWIGRIALVAVVAGAAAAAGRAAGSSAPRPSGSVDATFESARRAVEAKEWDRAVRLLMEVAVRQGSSDPDVFNLLGYAERNRGNLDRAFKYYERALRLDPSHRGAHEYVGVAYLLAGNLAAAEEHLAALERLCGRSCEEYEDLARDVARYRRSAQAR